MAAMRAGMEGESTEVTLRVVERSEASSSAEEEVISRWCCLLSALCQKFVDTPQQHARRGATLHAAWVSNE